MKTLVAKMDAPGVEGIVVGYETQPGGCWTGDYLVAVLADFEVGKKKARILVAKSVVFRIKEISRKSNSRLQMQGNC